MGEKTDLESIDAGARFVRGDLHIHSYRGSHDVKDVRLTPAAIVEEARKRGVSIVALSDHNSIDNVRTFLEAAEGFPDVLAVAAVELSCPEGHLLVYTPSHGTLQRVFGQISIETGRTASSETSCNTGMFDVLERVKAVDGFAVLAHVDVASGFEERSSAWTPQKKAILCHSALLGHEVRNWPSPISYGEDEKDKDRKAAGRERIAKLGLPASLYRFAGIVNSDAHDLDRVGANDAGRQRTTRYKMSTLSFQSLKLALSDPGARVRIEEDLPGEAPRLLGIRIRGGFLDQATVRLSSNLTCVIGGRGTGKTTAIRCAESVAHVGRRLGTDDEMRVLESEAGPDELELELRDALGTKLAIRKTKGESVQLVGAEGRDVITDFRIDCFRQSEASDLAPEVRKDPGALLRYFDKHIPGVAALLESEKRLREQLIRAQAKSRIMAEKSAACEAQLASTQGAVAQVKEAKQSKVGELGRIESQLSKTRQIGERMAQLDQGLAEISALRPFAPLLEEYPDLFGIPAETEGVQPEADEEGAPAILSAHREWVQKSDDALGAWLEQTLEPMRRLLVERISELEVQATKQAKEADDKKEEFRAKKIVFDIKRLKILARDAAKLEQHQTALKKTKAELQEALAAEDRLLDDRRAVCSQLSTIRTSWATRVMRGLPQIDLRFSLKFREGRYSSDTRSTLVELMGWRTNQVQRADALLSDLGYWPLLDLLRGAAKGKERAVTKAINAIRAVKGYRFDQGEASQLVERLATPEALRRLASAYADCLPELKVRLGSQGAVRDYVDLSIGQQQSVLLTLLLSDEEANAPLLVDQPEDHLDSEFIFRAIVPALRRAKERRQVVLVTHNANVCVLGDAEQIVVLGSSGDRGHVVCSGAIDGEELRRAACDVLEGTEEAFRLRGLMYRIA
ncbi:MAG: TrlF family AAA-like ATPase [Sandaracinaceae bacterium]